MKPRYTLSVAVSKVDTYPNNFKCGVTVQDHKTGKRFWRRGYGKFIGNFSPIWISIGGVKKQLTEWERETL